MLCTIYSKTIRSKKEKTSILDLEELCARFQHDEKRRRTVEALRAELPTLPPSWHWKDIQSLPLVCPGLLQKRRRNGDIDITYNGVVLLEVGGLSSKAEVQRVKERAAGWPTTLAAFIGSSGRSVKILVSGTLEDGSRPTEPEGISRFHRRLYELSAQAYATVVGCALKPKNAQPDDTFRWTYDPAPYVNPSAQPVRLLRSDILHAASAADSPGERVSDALEYAPDSAQPSMEANSLYRRRFALAISQAKKNIELEAERKAPKKGDKEATPPSATTSSASQAVSGLTTPLPLLEATALEALRLSIPQEEAVRQARRNLHFHELEDEDIRIAIESVYLEHAAQSGHYRNHSMQLLTYSLQEFMRQRYDLRFNELTNGVEWRRNNSASFIFQPLDTRVMNTMIQEAHESGLDVFDRDMKRFLGFTRVRDYNAARAYLRSIEERWDGRTDYIGALADRVPTQNPHWREWFHTWFLGMVAQWDGWDPLHGNSVVPLLIGPQGCGKSTFGQLLLPPELRDVGYRELVDFGSKTEVERQLTTSLLINLDEFNQISEKTQQGFLKNLIQKASVKGRRPYSSVVQNLPRFASFIATTNMTDVLADPSGSRRFLVAEVRDGERIDTTSPVPYAKIYAQAVAELEAGKPLHYFTPDRVAELEAYNSRYTNARMEVLRFLDTFEPATEADEGTLRMKLSDIADAIRRHTGYSYSDKAFNYLGRWLTGEAKALRVRKTVSNGSTCCVPVTNSRFVRSLVRNGVNPCFYACANLF